MYRKIMAATDYTELSDNAVQTAAAICQQQGATLVLMHVVESAVPLEMYGFELDYTTTMKKAEKSHLHNKANELRQQYAIPVEEYAGFGDVVTEILRRAELDHPDLIVVGTHGSSGFRRFFIGSAAYRLVKHTTCPVLTIPGQGLISSFRRILFPIRLGTDPVAKYDHIRPLVLSNHATLLLYGLTTDEDASRLNEVIDREGMLEEKLNEDRVDYEIAFDHCHNYADYILNRAAETKADLIVITASLDHTIKEFFIGPFAQQVLNHAGIPVLSVRNG